jgi:hypothetical protein
MFVFDILLIPSGCIQICSGCIVASCIPSGYGPAFSVKVSVENGEQSKDQCQGTDIYIQFIRTDTSPTESLRFACPVMCNMYSPVQGCTNFQTFEEPPQNFRLQNSGKQQPHSGFTDFRCHRTKLIHQGDSAPWVCAPLV